MQVPQEWQATDGRMWVFGYGSLIWDPGFPHDRHDVARLSGWHRSFCMSSIHYRGCVERPGLVLALDEAGDAHCDGVAFRVTGGEENATLAILREREMVSSAYEERWLAIEVRGVGEVVALAFVIDRQHPQYCGRLDLNHQASIIAGAVGQRGPNRDYLFNTCDHLQALGIADADLTRLADLVRAL